MKAKFRLGVILLFLLAMLSPLATTAAGAAAATQAVTCDDFTTQEEAQDALEDDPDLAETLDEDDNDIACEDLPSEAEATSEGDDSVDPDDVQLPDDEATGEATEEDATEEAAGEDEPSGASGDVDEYLATIQDEVDGLQEGVDRFIEINTEASEGDLTQAEAQELADELNGIAADWADYPDVAAEIEAPEGVEEIDAAYQDLAETTGQAGEDWATYWDTPSDSAEEDEAREVFAETFSTMQEQLDELNTLLDEGAGEDPTPEGTEDGDAYIATIQDELDTLQTRFEDFDAALEIASDPQSSGAEVDDAVEESNAVADDWSAYPDVAAEIMAPEGFEEIDTAYQDLAVEVGEMGDNWAASQEAESGSTEADEALAAYEDARANVETGIDDLTVLLEDAGGGGEATEEPTEEATEEATEEPSGDVDEYLTAVREHTDELTESIDRFNEIIALGADATYEEAAEVREILELWADAPDVAAELEAPSGLSEIEDTYTELTDELATASDSFDALINADQGSTESDEALDDFVTAITNAETLAADLDELLTDEGF